MSNDDYIKAHFNSGQELRYADRRATVASLIDACDLLKIDTDGYDLQALHGSEPLFRQALRRPLVVQVEAQLNGSTAAGESTITGMAEFLHGYGYTWFDMTLQHYRRAALPGKFLYGIPAGNADGPAGFCDALFIDDPLLVKGKLTNWLKDGIGRSMKLVALYDVLGYPDCSAELIVALSRHPASADKDDWKALLHVIDPDYDNLITRFKKDYTSFF